MRNGTPTTSTNRWRRLPLLLVLVGGLAAGATTACTSDDDGPVIVNPGAPGESGRVLDDPPEVADQAHTEADVRFLHAMIAHHAQALRMTALVPDRAGQADLPLFAQRIELSQEAEITLMEDWLEARGEPTSDSDHDHGTGELMPGMLTEEQFTALEQATGAEFDRLFLEAMIYHHEGALTMVEELRAVGGGQEVEIFQLVTHIDGDQRIEISRMRSLLREAADR